VVGALLIQGIDIAAKTVDLVVRQNDKNSPVKTFQQTPSGRATLIEFLQKYPLELIVMEATGIYYLDLAVALHDAKMSISVINPKSFNHFAQMKLEHSKTDSIDAALLAEYAQRMTPKKWIPPHKDKLKLRDISRQINRLTGDCTKAKNRLHAMTSYEGTSDIVILDEQDGIASLENRIQRLRTAALEMIKADERLIQQFNNLLAAKDVGEVSAIAMLGELIILPETLKANQVSRHAGLDVRLNQSGSSLNRPGRLSKAGNTYLRCALFMPAMSAVRHDPNAKAFYEALVARGKKKIQAICAVMRKMLTGIWACFKLNIPYDSSKLFSEEHKKLVFKQSIYKCAHNLRTR
jgi:transposase